MFYAMYKKLARQGKIAHGLSPRLPDYAMDRWLHELESAVLTCTRKNLFLDIGAGDGRFTHILASTYFKHGVAIEIQPPQSSWKPLLKQCPNITLLDGLLQDLLPKLKDHEPFDFVLLSEVFEHIPLQDITPFLNALSQVLAKDAVIFLSTPNRIVQGPAETSSMWHERQPYGHHKHYTPEELQAILQQHHFNVMRTTYECHRIKSRAYDRYFYFLSRLDYRLLHSRKLPAWLRTCYGMLSWPCITITRLCFLLLARIVRMFERYNINAQNALTMMLIIRPNQKEAYASQHHEHHVPSPQSHEISRQI